MKKARVRLVSEGDQIRNWQSHHSICEQPNRRPMAEGKRVWSTGNFVPIGHSRCRAKVAKSLGLPYESSQLSVRTNSRLVELGK